MANYYSSNAVYEQLACEPKHDFLWASGHVWMLIYGDGDSNPLACVFVHSVSAHLDSRASSVFNQIAVTAGLPFFEVGFDDSTSEIHDVQLAINGASMGNISLQELKKYFEKHGVPVNGSTTNKSVNSATSSAYHDWQRSNLGQITVSDIDLVRVSTDDKPIEIIELKRSYYSLDRWQPFPADFKNFNLLKAVTNRCSCDLTIAYNVRTKEPFNDDASKLSLFSYERDLPKALGQVSFDQFVNNQYRRA